MTLPELSIKRHVFAFMLSAVLVLFGIISYQRLGVDRFPYIEFPVITVTTTEPGANPDTIDASVTNVIETAANSVTGIDHIQSSSSPGVSVVAITFNLDKNVDAAFNEVQSKVNQVLRNLPKDVDPPVVAKVETNAQPILWLTLTGDRTQQQLNLYASNVIKKRLETIDGVGQVLLGGQRNRTIRVELNPARMSAFGLTPQDILAAFSREHLQVPGGFLTNARTEYLFKLDLEYHKVADLKRMIVAYRAGAPVHLEDVADVRDALEDNRQLARINGQQAVGLGIVKVANANTVAIVNAVQKKLAEEIDPQLPPGMHVEIASNDALYIQEMVNALKEHLVEGTLLAALVVLFFLRSIRSTLIISIAIPVSLLGAIAVMYFAGFTFNTLTLLALLLLIGVVVDDAIVVLENIFRHREEIDPDPVAAALNGSRQVFFAVLAASLSLVSIFAPVIFMGGIIGQFFKSFAVVVTFGVLVSLFVSVTLTPMLCSRFLKVQPQHGKLYNTFDRLFTRMDTLYRRLLALALAHRWKVVLVTVLVVLSSGYFFASVGKTFVPEEDEGRYLVSFKTPLGSSMDYTDSRLKRIEAVLAKHPEISTYFTTIGVGQGGQVNQGTAYISMQPKARRALSQQQSMAQVTQQLAQIPGVQAFASPVPIIGGQRGEPLQFVVNGPNLDQVARIAEQLQQKLNITPGLGRVDMDLQVNLPELQLTLDRTRAAALGLSAQDIAMALNAYTGGVNVARFNDEPGDGQRYDIRIKGQADQFTRPADLAKIYLRSKDGQMVRLDTIAGFRQTRGAAVIGRYDLQYAAMFFASPTLPLAEAVNQVNAAAKGLLPAGYHVKMVGQAEEFAKTAANVSFAFVLALVLLYMVLASQFNSFLQPLIIMVAQPLAIIGGVLGLWLFRETLNIYSMIGLVLLIGLVAKNSILLVDLTNQLRAEGKPVDRALAEACPVRLRPVLMTSLTVILALLPAALGIGAGAATNGPLAVAVIGGMISSTLLTLVVVPAVYSLVENATARRREKRAARQAESNAVATVKEPG